MSEQPGEILEFGPFRLLPGQRVLLEDGRPLRLGSRALEILITLIARPGELVGKDELIARVWPETVVEEGNLRVHMAALRKVLGDGQPGRRFVVNVPGRGYSFVAPVHRTREAPAAVAPATVPPMPPAGQHQALHPGQHLPAPLTRMVGRADAVDAIAAQLRQRRFVTIVGPGGIGKTTVAIAVAEAVAGQHRDGVRFVDFASVAGVGQAPRAVAAALDLAVTSADPLPVLAASLKDKQVLLVLDGCEHVVAEVAALAEHVLRAGPAVHVLATSREPLRAEGEQVQRLAPLGVPERSPGLSAAEALRYPAIQLFVERAVAAFDAFEMSDADAPVVADICRRLDGIPLAIELGAGRIDVFGIGGLAAHLDDRFRLVTRGRRTALPRHQTLGATLDWSHELLSEPERTILRRLGVFVGRFDLESAVAVAADADLDRSEVGELIANLAEKSLVSANVGGRRVEYRLLDTTRAYALAKLADSGERATVARRHGERYLDLFTRAAAEAEAGPAAAWLENYGGGLDNVRAALDWAFSPDGDAALGAALTAAAVPLWLHLALFDECRAAVERALARTAGGGNGGERRAMQLFAALGVTMQYANRDDGLAADRARAWSRTLEIAERLDDVDFRLRATWGLWIARFNNGEHRAALALAQQFRDVAAAAGWRPEAMMGHRMIGFSLQLLGEAAEARRNVEQMLAAYVPPADRSHILRYQFDQRLTAAITLAQTLWVQGWPDRAMQTVATAVDEARALAHAMSLCNVLAQAACPIALLTGELAAAERYIALLLETAARRGLVLLGAWGRCYQGRLAARRGDLAGGLAAFRAALAELPPDRFALRYTAFLGELADLESRAGHADAGVAAISQALDRAAQHEEHWCMPELLRIRAEIAARQDAADPAAERWLHQSLDWARRQEALSWQLRSATGLARLLQRRGVPAAARDLLQPVLARFSEGFGTDDLKAAAVLLATA